MATPARLVLAAYSVPSFRSKIPHLTVAILALVGFVPVLPATLSAQVTDPLEGISAGSVYNHHVTIQLSDELKDKDIQIILNGYQCAPSTVVSEEGDYIVEFIVPGSTGETSSIPPVKFGIDLTAPKITFVWPRGDTGKGIPDVEVEDLHWDRGAAQALEMFLDGEPFSQSDVVEPGEHEFGVTARDLATNTAQESTKITVTADCPPESYVEYVRPRKTLSAAHFYFWYRGAIPPTPMDCTKPKYRFWCYCVNTPKGIEPARGFYDSTLKSVAKAQMNQMARYGIDIASLEWNGNTFHVSNYLNAVVPAIADSNMKNFVLLYDLAFRFGRDPDFNDAAIRNQFTADFQNFAASNDYFKNGKYFLFANKPVVYLYAARAVTGSSGNIQSTFFAAQNAARSAGFSGLYLVADYLYWGSTDYDRLRLMEPSAVTSFAPLDAGEGVPEGQTGRPVRTWADKVSQLYLNAKSPLTSFANGVDIQPGIFVQYDDRGFDDLRCTDQLRQVHRWHLVDSSDWTYMIRNAGIDRQYVAEVHRIHWDCSETATSDSDWQSIIWSYSYNEWGEGAGMEELKVKTPNYPFGFGFEPLIALKEEVK